MTAQQKDQTKSIFSAIALSIALVQMFLDTANAANFSATTKMYIGAGAMFIAIVSTGFKQYFDNEIDNRTLYIQVLLFVAYVAGGLLQQLGELDFLGADVQSLLRLFLTFISLAVPLIVKAIDKNKPL